MKKQELRKLIIEISNNKDDIEFIQNDIIKVQDILNKTMGSIESMKMGKEKQRVYVMLDTPIKNEIEKAYLSVSKSLEMLNKLKNNI